MSTRTDAASNPARRRMPRLTEQDSEYRSQHIAFRDYLEHCEPWRRARDVIVAIDSIRLPSTTVDQTASLSESLLAAIDAGEDPTATLMGEAESAARRAAAVSIAASAMQVARAEAVRDLDSAFGEQLPHLLAHLSSQHEELWAQLARYRRPADLVNAEAAVTAGCVEELEGWRDLLAKRRALRAKWHNLARHLGGDLVGHYRSAIRNPQAWPLLPFYEAGDGFVLNPENPRAEDDSDYVAVIPPWSVHGDVDDAEWVAWALGSEFEAWLPPAVSTEQLHKVGADPAAHRAGDVVGQDAEAPSGAGYRREKRTVARQMDGAR